MARLARITPSEIPIHVIQRGNNHQIVFAQEADFKAYLNWLKDYSNKYHVKIHAWCLMTNHVHLLCTGKTEDGISKMMQSIGRQYVRYFNQKYKRTGTLWDGRYKSCLVEAESYLFGLYRYIELNPVRAGMVNDPSEYSWSSYSINAFGKISELCTPHSLYLSLGASDKQLQVAYVGLFSEILNVDLIKDIREASNKGMAVGKPEFLEEIETLTGRRVTSAKRGRPVGWRKDSEFELG